MAMSLLNLPSKSRTLLGTFVAVPAGMMLSACGAGAVGDDTPPVESSSTIAIVDTTTTTAPTPVDVPSSIAFTDDRGKTVEILSTERIIPLDGNVAEIVFALGLGDRVVATDISAVYPAEADALPEIGYQRALAAEPIAAFEPTVVIGTDLAGPAEVLDELERLGIPVVIVPAPPTKEGPAIKIRAVGAALGVEEEADSLAARVESEIAEAARMGRAASVRPRVLALYVRGSNTQLVLGEGSGFDWIIDVAGGIDVADDLGVIENAAINIEAIIAAEPDVIVVPELGLASVDGAEGLLAIPGLAETPAGRRGAVLSYEDQLMLGNGPRTGQFLLEFIDDLERLSDPDD
jgi:iron complex transport system substrate-binding protein